MWTHIVYSEAGSLVCQFCRIFLFKKDPGIVAFFFQINYRQQQPSLCSLELVELLPIYRYSVDIFDRMVLQEYLVLAVRSPENLPISRQN